MDAAYTHWLFVIGAGAALALAMKPRHIAICGAALFVGAIGGLLVTGSRGGGNAAMLFGVAAMIIPVVFALLTAGAWLGRSVLGRIRRGGAGS